MTMSKVIYTDMVRVIDKASPFYDWEGKVLMGLPALSSQDDRNHCVVFAEDKQAWFDESQLAVLPLRKDLTVIITDEQSPNHGSTGTVMYGSCGLTHVMIEGVGLRTYTDDQFAEVADPRHNIVVKRHRDKEFELVSDPKLHRFQGHESIFIIAGPREVFNRDDEDAPQRVRAITDGVAQGLLEMREAIKRLEAQVKDQKTRLNASLEKAFYTGLPVPAEKLYQMMEEQEQVA